MRCPDAWSAAMRRRPDGHTAASIPVPRKAGPLQTRSEDEPGRKTPGGPPIVGRSRWSNAVTIMASTVLALVLVEVVYRLATGVPVFKVANWRVERVVVGQLGHRTVIDPVLGWTLKPHNTLEGHNTLDHGIRRNFEETTIRTGAILAVGDSFTEGWEVADDDTWPAYLERLVGMPVVNGGTGAYGTDQIVLRAEQLLPIVRPKTLIVGFLDFDIVRTAHSHFAAPKPYFTLDGSALRYHPPARLEPERESGWFASVGKRARDVLGYSAVADHLLARLAPDYWYGKGLGDFQLAPNDAVAVTCRLLERLKTTVDRQGIRIVLFMQYYAYFIYTADTAPRDARRVIACAREAGIQVVDQFPSLRAVAAADPAALRPYYMVYGDLHTHMSARGNQHAAELLAAALRD